eukprot:gene2773-2015_t
MRFSKILHVIPRSKVHNTFSLTRQNMSGFQAKVKAHDALDEASATGHFVRTAAGFREIISPSHAVFQPAANRYHLYVSYACPWANRCLAMLYLKGLEDVIGVTVVHPTWQKTKPANPDDKHCGWAFFDSANDQPLTTSTGHGSFAPSGCSPDPNAVHAKFIRDLYEASKDVLGKYSVPVLWDKETNQIVNNESSEIVRMFNSLDVFGGFVKGPFAHHDFYPVALRPAIDEVNQWVYESINDGVYKCGFARSQLAYDQAITDLYAGLDRVEAILAKQRYLVADGAEGRSVFTEADIRLFMTLVRFDEVYVVYFKCNVRPVASYPHIRQYMRDIYQTHRVAEIVNMEHIKTHYYTAHPLLNAYGIIPRGPNVV